MTRKPYVFIGSSSEGKDIATAIKENLDNDADVVVWDQNAFELSRTYLESLEKQMHLADFAIMVLTGDDITISRTEEKASPRDNVLFELGLAIGSIGRDRCYFVYDDSKEFKLPSDLMGVNGATYRLQDSGNYMASLGSASNKIRSMIRYLGPRFKMPPETQEVYRDLLSFCEKIEGDWWERIMHDSRIAISHLRIFLDKQTATLKMEGRSYDVNGNNTAFWSSNSVSINNKERKILYFWKGTHPSQSATPFEGVGDILFYETGGEIKEGQGEFSDINILDLKSIHKKPFFLNKCTNEEITIMNAGDKNKISELVIKKIGE